MSSTSSAALAASVSDSNELASTPSHSAKPIFTAVQCSPNDGQASLFTETSASSLCRADMPKSSAVGSPARTSVPRPMPLRELMAKDRAYGASSPVSLAKYDPASRSWKTCPPSESADSDEFSETWPRSGTTRSGIAFQHPSLVPLIRGIGSGLWPTGRKCSGKASSGINRADFYRAMGFSQFSTTKGGENRSPPGGPLNPAWIEWYFGYPIGWSDLDVSVTQSSHRLPKSSGARSDALTDEQPGVKP
jgi:hypothetical protein